MIEAKNVGWKTNRYLLRIKQLKQFELFLWIICLVGLAITTWSIIKLTSNPPSWNYYFLALLLVVGSFNTTSQEVKKTGITWDIGGGVVLGSIPFFGIEGAVLLTIFRNLVLWLLKPAHRQSWKKSSRQLAFNLGMHILAVTIGGFILLSLRERTINNLFLNSTLPFLVAAVADEGVNIALISTIIRLQHGRSFNLRAMLRENTWAMQLTILTTGLGSALIAWAILNYNWLGIAIFFLPTLLSAYALRLYVHNMQVQMDRLEDMVAERTTDLAALNRQKDAFLAVLTHDMLTPLSSIRLFTEIIQEDPESIKDDPNLTTMMFHSLKTLMNLVQDVLDIEKLQSGVPLPSKKQQINLSQILFDVIGTVQISAAKKNIDITFDDNTPAIWILGDAQYLERIFLNLLSNAVKYTPRDGRIAISAQLDKFIATVKIEDSGYGIPAEDLPTIFDAYSRSDAHVYKEKGNGLGLAIAKALVEEHKGRIHAESEEDKGTTFIVSLPVSH